MILLSAVDDDRPPARGRGRRECAAGETSTGGCTTTMTPLRDFQVQKTRVYVYSTKRETSKAAARHAAEVLRSTIAAQSWARIIVGTGNSQLDLIEALVRASSLDWGRIEVFHMDEYIGMPQEHPASFRRWLKTRIADVVHPGKVNWLAGDAPDLDAEAERYAALLRAAPIDLCFLGFGENGHIAFNDPHVANFHDPLLVKRVEMDTRCRLQQVGEGHFASLEAMPKAAFTLTCPALMSARHVVACVPEGRKAEAVRNAIEGPLTEKCPASIVFTHPHARVFLDADSASLLSNHGGSRVM